MQKYCAQSSHVVAEATKRPHGTLVWAEARFSVPVRSARSAAFTCLCSRGSSRNQSQKAPDHTRPSRPKISNERRQPTNCSTNTTRSGVKAPPQRADSHRMLWAFTRSSGGSQVVKALVRFGKQPASPAPKSARVTTSDRKLQVQPVAAVKNDHQTTTRVSTLRGPSLSPSQPPGISKSE